MRVVLTKLVHKNLRPLFLVLKGCSWHPVFRINHLTAICRARMRIFSFPKARETFRHLWQTAVKITLVWKTPWLLSSYSCVAWSCRLNPVTRLLIHPTPGLQIPVHPLESPQIHEWITAVPVLSPPPQFLPSQMRCTQRTLSAVHKNMVICYN